MRIKKGDTVMIMSGKDKGKKAKVLKAFPRSNMILVEGVNIKKAHKKSRRQDQKGQIVSLPAPFPACKAQIFCSKCSKPVRVAYEKTEKGRVRVCKKCKSFI
jgi:large subunit ribosomal protein L24